MREDCFMIAWRNFFSCNPFRSRTSMIQKVIEIDPCKNIIDTEFTIDFCPRCNSNKCLNPNHSSANCNRPIFNNPPCENNSLDCEKDIKIQPCTPYIQRTIQANACDGKLLQIRLNLLHIRINRKLSIGILLCSNDTPYAFKMQKVCIHPSYTCCKSHRRNCRCVCTNVNFDFLISDTLNQDQLSLKIITQYLC